jgi:hypothetical protein
MSGEKPGSGEPLMSPCPQCNCSDSFKAEQLVDDLIGFNHDSSDEGFDSKGNATCPRLPIILMSIVLPAYRPRKRKSMVGQDKRSLKML